MPHALLVEDDERYAKAMTEFLRQEGFTVAAVGTKAEARERAANEPTELVILDLMLPDGNGLDLVEQLREVTSAETVVVTGHASMETAVEALRLGVLDYLTKPLDTSRLRTILANVARMRELKGEVQRLRDELKSIGRFGAMIGISDPMQEVYDLISRVAPTDATVLITGESGTGKELAAQTIHDLSPRRSRPFVPINCGAVSATLIESELFGHERGSFTGANRTHKGVFERAEGGTLLLDEITEMPIDLQVKLLRVLESGSFSRVGGERQITADLRVIAASNRSPKNAVEEERLREDLLYRLSVFPIELPPLRARSGDVELLADHFLGELNEAEDSEKSFTRDALQRLRLYDWPGNVRELRNAVRRAFILADQEIDASHLPRPLGAGEKSPVVRHGRIEIDVGTSLADAERALIFATLDRLEGNKKRTAEALGVSVKTLYNRLKAYEAGRSGEG